MKWYLCTNFLLNGSAVWDEFCSKKQACAAYLVACKKYANDKQVQLSIHQL